MDQERYDRQLRLWGPDGQLKLSSASVCIIGSSAVATEVLKNLILPGIGSFCIVDDAAVTERDLSLNFFLDPTDLGSSRAKAVTQKLLELNPSVRGSHANSFSQVSMENFDAVVACNSIFQYSVSKLINVTSIGFLGRVQLVLAKPHVVLEPKSEEGSIDDLGILNPWSSLDKFADSFSFDSNAEDKDFFHIPWLVLLIKAAKLTRSSGKPVTHATISQAITELEGLRKNGRNFHEARENIYRITALSLDDEIKSKLSTLLKDLELENVQDAMCTDTARCLRVLLEFHKKEGRFPVFGSALPDMTSTTNSYTQLVGIFKSQWETDLNILYRMCPKVSENFMRKIVANFRNVEVFQSSACLRNPSISPFSKRHNTGTDNIDDSLDEEEADIVRMLNGTRLEADSALQLEFDRYSNGVELHAVSTVVGAVAAQELVKLLTNQFVPINDSFVFNGIKGAGFTYKST